MAHILCHSKILIDLKGFKSFMPHDYKEIKLEAYKRKFPRK